MNNLISPKIDLELCPLCKGSGFRKDSDFTKIDCICEETGNKYFLFELDKNQFDNGRGFIKIDYQDRTLYSKIEEYLESGVVYHDGHHFDLYINSLHRIEPFYSLKDYNLKNYHFPPLEDPLFPFKRK